MAKTVLVTGGTVFVSRYIAEYYVSKGFEVYVLNRNTRLQSPKVKLIQADRHNLGNALRDIHFHVIIDTAYTAADVNMLLDGLRSFDEYILISSSAVYPESAIQPFAENAELGLNKFWGKYGIDKIEAEKALFSRNPNAYVLRPPYLYGKMNNIYREAFVFDCALANRKFYLPKDGSMKLQFFHVEDLCRFIHIIIERKPKNHIFNVGNKQPYPFVNGLHSVIMRSEKPLHMKLYLTISSKENIFRFMIMRIIWTSQNSMKLCPTKKIS